MGQIEVKRDLDGINVLCLLKLAVHRDSRGYFMEIYNQKDMEATEFI